MATLTIRDKEGVAQIVPLSSEQEAELLELRNKIQVLRLELEGYISQLQVTEDRLLMDAGHHSRHLS